MAGLAKPGDEWEASCRREDPPNYLCGKTRVCRTRPLSPEWSRGRSGGRAGGQGSPGERAFAVGGGSWWAEGAAPLGTRGSRVTMTRAYVELNDASASFSAAGRAGRAQTLMAAGPARPD